MTWIVGAGIGLYLLFRFPRQMGILIAAVVVTGGAVAAWMFESDRRRSAEYARDNASIYMTAIVDRNACSDPRYPVLVRFLNRHATKTATKVWFNLRGYRPGFSDAVLEGTSLSSDRILAPSDVYGTCWSNPGRYGMPVEDAPLPSALEWKAEVSTVVWRDSD